MPRNSGLSPRSARKIAGMGCALWRRSICPSLPFHQSSNDPQGGWLPVHINFPYREHGVGVDAAGSILVAGFPRDVVSHREQCCLPSGFLDCGPALVLKKYSTSRSTARLQVSLSEGFFVYFSRPIMNVASLVSPVSSSSSDTRRTRTYDQFNEERTSYFCPPPPAPRQPLSPPAEDSRKCSLPSISSLLECADGMPPASMFPSLALDGGLPKNNSPQWLTMV